MLTHAIPAAQGRQETLRRFPAMEQTEMVDYRQLSLKTLNEPRYSHVKLLLFWPSFGIVFYILERVWIRDGYHIMSCSLDAHIPFCEWFVIPYFF